MSAYNFSCEKHCPFSLICDKELLAIKHREQSFPAGLLEMYQAAVKDQLSDTAKKLSETTNRAATPEEWQARLTGNRSAEELQASIDSWEAERRELTARKAALVGFRSTIDAVVDCIHPDVELGESLSEERTITVDFSCQSDTVKTAYQVMDIGVQ